MSFTKEQFRLPFVIVVLILIGYFAVYDFISPGRPFSYDWQPDNTIKIVAVPPVGEAYFEVDDQILTIDGRRAGWTIWQRNGGRVS